mmetsp:Transcript_8144/g.36338  ORF Transcript_8144/g.36338 Transcript_8144/m.36338 type:complete len:204 (+) Transcript_8144:1147-1758(+)
MKRAFCGIPSSSVLSAFLRSSSPSPQPSAHGVSQNQQLPRALPKSRTIVSCPVATWELCRSRLRACRRTPREPQPEFLCVHTQQCPEFSLELPNSPWKPIKQQAIPSMSVGGPLLKTRLSCTNYFSSLWQSSKRRKPWLGKDRLLMQYRTLQHSLPSSHCLETPARVPRGLSKTTTDLVPLSTVKFHAPVWVLSAQGNDFRSH